MSASFQFRFAAELMEPRIVLSGVMTLMDADGDSYTVKLAGPGTADVTQDDLGDGLGPIGAILLSGTTKASSLSISVKRGAQGDGAVSIGEITGSGLKTLKAMNSDLVGAGINLGGAAGDKVKLTLGNVDDGANITTAAQLASLKTQSIGALAITAPSVGKLLTKAGAMRADLEVAVRSSPCR